MPRYMSMILSGLRRSNLLCQIASGSTSPGYEPSKSPKLFEISSSLEGRSAKAKFMIHRARKRMDQIFVVCCRKRLAGFVALIVMLLMEVFVWTSSRISGGPVDWWAPSLDQIATFDNRFSTMQQLKQFPGNEAFQIGRKSSAFRIELSATGNWTLVEEDARLLAQLLHYCYVVPQLKAKID